MLDMKRVALSSKGRGPKQLHIEADGCIINVQVGLRDVKGQLVTHVSVTADGDRYSGEPEWWVAPGTKVDKTGVGLRIIEKKPRTSRHGDRRSRR